MEAVVIGNRIKVLLHNKNISYKVLAQNIGITEDELIKKLNGEMNFTIEEATKIKDYLELNLELAHNIFFNPDFNMKKV